MASGRVTAWSPAGFTAELIAMYDILDTTAIKLFYQINSYNHSLVTIAAYTIAILSYSYSAAGCTIAK